MTPHQRKLRRGNRPIRIIILRDLDDGQVSVSDDGGAFEDEDGNSERWFHDERTAKVEADRREAKYIDEDPTVAIAVEVREKRGKITLSAVNSIRLGRGRT